MISNQARAESLLRALALPCEEAEIEVLSRELDEIERKARWAAWLAVDSRVPFRNPQERSEVMRAVLSGEAVDP